MKTLCLLIAAFLLPQWSPAETALPRVLILGDSIYQQPAAELAREFKGKVEVVHARVEPGEVFNSSTAVAYFDRLLGEKPWDLIHFNAGLGDLVYRAPGMKAFRTFPKPAGGVRATNPRQYEQNLRAWVKRLKATGAPLVWASTTPIRHSTTRVFEMGTEIEYNAIAAKVMAEHQVPVNDMYGYTKSLIDMNKPAGHGADPFFFDRKPLHPPMAAILRETLKLDP